MTPLLAALLLGAPLPLQAEAERALPRESAGALMDVASGRLGMRQALSDSCDVWFYRMARLLGPARLLEAARTLGLGRPTGSDVEGEAAGAPAIHARVGVREDWEELVRALRDAVQSGTGAAAGDLPIAGKTGTAPVAGQEEPLAWFAGFAPDDAPEVAVVTFVPEGLGSRDAAAAAADLVRVYFQWRDRQGPAGR